MRSLVSAAVAALAIPLAPSTAIAGPGAVVMTCTVGYSNTTGIAECTAVGADGRVGIVDGPVHMNFSSFPGCPEASAYGTMSGALSAAFTWTRIGASGLMSTTGDLNGSAAIAFSQPCQPIAGGETAAISLEGF